MKIPFSLFVISIIVGIIGLAIGILIGISFNGPTEPQIQDNGDFYVEITNPTNSSHLIHYNAFKGNEENLEIFLNSQFNFPHDVYLIIDECDDPNPKYYDQLNQILICYIFFDEVFQTWSEYEQSIDKKGVFELINGTVVFSIYHELAHALIEVFDLPVVGNEEIAADQFAIFLLLPLIIEENSIAFYLAGPLEFFNKEMEQYETIKDIAFLNKHPIGVQRTINIACLAYGKLGPEPFEGTPVEKIPAERLSECYRDSVIISNNWKELLQDHLKPNSAFAKDYLTKSYFYKFET